MVIYKEPFSKTLRGDLFGNLAPYRNGNPHRGMDWHPAENTVIPAISDAKVHNIFWSDALGNVVEVVDAEGVYTQYCHLAQKPTSLKKGDTVKLGQPIGRVGSTGTSTTGPHLHISMAKVANSNTIAYDKLIDPLKYILAHSKKGK